MSPRISLKKEKYAPLGNPCTNCRFFAPEKRYCKNGIDTFTKKTFCKFKNVSRFIESYSRIKHEN